MLKLAAMLGGDEQISSEKGTKSPQGISSTPSSCDYSVHGLDCLVSYGDWEPEAESSKSRQMA